MKKILVTGATGFLGAYVLKEFIDNYEIIAIGRNEIKLSSNLPNEMVKNAKTRKLHKYNTVLKSVESTLNSDFEKLSESNTNEFPLVRILETSPLFSGVV